MTHEPTLLPVHPPGDQPLVASGTDQPPTPVPPTLDTFAGPVTVEWDPSVALTPLGQAPFFIEFLKVSGLFEPWLADCPLRYTSPNAPKKRDVLGTLALAILSGCKRYAHITALRCDAVLPDLLGMTKVVSEVARKLASEDAVRGALKSMPEPDSLEWLQRHLDHCISPLLGERYVLDIDTTVKPLYGHQEGAVISYNPKKPGRPSHVHHTYMMAGLRLVMSVETAPGNEHTGAHATPGLWNLLDRFPRDQWPALLRGDSGIASESVMAEAERRAVAYLFKLRQTKNVKKLIWRTFAKAGWVDAGQGWQGRHEELRLDGWGRQRRVVVLRRRLKDGVVAGKPENPDQLQLGFVEIGPDAQLYEYAVLVTSLDLEVLSIAQLYRDRADCENVFDELKNQWGWGGFTTADLARCRITARMVALVYNWWNLFVRLAEPDKHLEAITSRPLLLTAIAECTHHARQTTLRVTSAHGRGKWAQRVLSEVSAFLRRLAETTEQLTGEQRWWRILAHALRSWLGGRQLRPPPRLTAPA